MAAKKKDYVGSFFKGHGGAAQSAANPAPAFLLDAEPEGTREIPLEKLVAASWNARRRFDPEALDSLAKNLRTHGQIEPIVVRPLTDGSGNYQVVVGERRLRAAKLVGFHALKCDVRHLTDERAKWIALSENLAREDLNEFEETVGLFELIKLALNADTPEAESARAVVEQTSSSQAGDPVLETLMHYRTKRKSGTSQDAFLTFLDSVLEQSGTVKTATYLERKIVVLTMPEILKEHLMSGELTISQAAELQKVKEEAYLSALLDLALKGLSLAALKVIIQARTATERRRLLELASENPAEVDKTKLQAALRGLREGPADDRRFLARARKTRRYMSDKNLMRLSVEERVKLNELLDSLNKLLAK